ncbi:hypothetical protein C8F01DRAFT_1148257 [Mycena amicta]|nr:hypothetical protein C8F01DRAFT_1148257 [Mycena amicta]
MQLLDLPSELILACFCDLPFGDLFNLMSVGNQQLHTLLNESVIIRYRAELEAAGVDENLHVLGRMVISDRREALRQREQRWLHLSPLSRHTIRPDFTTASIYDVIGDFYIVGDASEAPLRPPTALRYAFTSPDGQKPAWSRVAANESIIDFAVSLPVYDLISIVTCIPDAIDATMLSIDIQLLQFSTGTRHPLAPPTDLHVATTPMDIGPPSVSIEVVGNVLAISLKYWAAETADHGRLYVYDWKLGKLLIKPRPSSNNAVVFLTADTLIVPNPQNGSLEVFSLPEAPPSDDEDLTVPIIHFFLLPDLAVGHMFLSFHCRGHPNPPPSPQCTNYSYALPSRAKFLSRGSDSILLFTFNTLSLNHLPLDHMFVLQRSHFITAVQTFTNHHDSTANGIGVEVAWNQWGPLCARFLDASVISRRFITMTSGQRLVCISPGAQNTPAPLRVLCFNEYVVREYREDYGLAGKADMAEVEHEHSIARLIEADPPDANEPNPLYTVSSAALATFQDPKDLISHLPYVEVVSKVEKFDYGAVVINEENIIGVKFRGPNFRALDSLEVLHFG